MAIEGFTEIFNMVYIAKKLHDIGKYELMSESFFDLLDCDTYYENMYGLIENLFEHYDYRYYERRMVELHILSDKVVVDFYTLAGKYGKRNNILDENNPYIKAAEQEIQRQLNFSYCLDWMVMGHTEPKRPYHSRLALFISQSDYVDLGCVAYRLIELYEWFDDMCAELRNILDDTMGGRQISLWEAVAA